jgi:hypothetical protein
MGVYISRKCPHCNKLIEFKRGNSQYFGDPLIKCTKCGGKIVLSNITEWELLTKGEKLSLLVSTFSWSTIVIIVSSFFLSFLGLVLLLAIFKTSINQTDWSTMIIIILGSIISIIRIYAHIRDIIKMIKESKSRTNDEEYFRYVSFLKNSVR